MPGLKATGRVKWRRTGWRRAIRVAAFSAVVASVPAAAAGFSGWLVFFEFEGAELSRTGEGVVHRFVDSYRRAQGPGCPTYAIVVAHMDSAERGPVDDARIAAVRRALAGEGWPEARSVGRSVGARRLLVQTGPGVREAQNRRAEIHAGTDERAGRTECEVLPPEVTRPPWFNKVACKLVLDGGTVCPRFMSIHDPEDAEPEM